MGSGGPMGGPMGGMGGGPMVPTAPTTGLMAEMALQAPAMAAEAERTGPNADAEHLDWLAVGLDKGVSNTCVGCREIHEDLQVEEMISIKSLSRVLGFMFMALSIWCD